MTEEEKKSEEYFAGFLKASQAVYDELTQMHHAQEFFDRKTVDEIWDRVKKNEIRARSGIYPL